MKVLKIIHTQGHGGAENAFRWLAQGLRQDGVDVFAAIPEQHDQQCKSWIASALDEVEIPFLTFDKRGSPMQLFCNISTLIGRVRPDIVHSHLLDSNFYTSMVCRKNGVPHVCTEHGDLLFIRSATAGIKYKAISLCSSMVVCVSAAVRKKAEIMIPARKLATISNGISFFNSRPSEFRAQAGITAKSMVIGNVGNLYPVKGQKFLIEAFARLLAFHPDSRLVLVGRGSEDENLKILVRKLGIAEGMVIFTGFRNDIEDIVNSFNLYIQPSLSEGHPLAVLEAMSAGIPVIASAVGGIPELFNREQYGTLATSGSSESLYARLLEFVCQPEVFLAKALAAREHVLETFSIARMSRKYIEVYEQAIAVKSS